MNKKGIASVISVVLLLAIGGFMAISLYYWGLSDITRQPTTSKPIPILAITLDTQAGYLQTIIINLGNEPLPKGDTFNVAENGAVTEIIEAINPGDQKVVWFWGRYTKDGAYLGFDTTATIYDPVSGTTAPSIKIPSVETFNVTAYDVFSAEGFEPSLGTIEDFAGVFWIVFTSNESIGSHDIWIMNSTNGINWKEPFQIAVQGTLVQEDAPQITYNGTFFVLYRSFYQAGGEAAAPRLKLIQSSDGSVWSTPVQTNVALTDPEPNEYQYNTENKRGFSFLLDDNNLFWLSYIDSTNLIIRNSTDGVTWDSEITVNNSAKPGKISLMQSNNGTYWIAYVGANTSTTEVISSPDGVTWGSPVVVSHSEFEPTCTGPSIIQTDAGVYFLFVDHSTDCDEIAVLGSADGIQWSTPSWIPTATSSDRHPSAMQMSDGNYLLAFANTDSIHVRSSSDPMIWQAPS